MASPPYYTPPPDPEPKQWYTPPPDDQGAAAAGTAPKETWGRVGGLAARAALQGITSPLDMFYNVPETLRAAIYSAVLGDKFDPHPLSIGGSLADLVGMPTPETTAERVGSALLSGATGGGVMGGAGRVIAGAKYLPQIAQNIGRFFGGTTSTARNVLQGAVGSGAAQIAGEEGASPGMQMLIGGLGGAAGAAPGGTLGWLPVAGSLLTQGTKAGPLAMLGSAALLGLKGGFKGLTEEELTNLIQGASRSAMLAEGNVPPLAVDVGQGVYSQPPPPVSMPLPQRPRTSLEWAPGYGPVNPHAAVLAGGT